jgi:5'-AMP-activated protein kinase regulatory gamma subunit
MILDILKKTKVEDCAQKPNTIIVLDSEESVPSGLQKLIDCGIVSAPVIDSKTNKFLGLIDITDILAFIVGIFKEPQDAKRINIFKRIETSSKFAKAKIGEITDLTKNPFTPIEEGSSVYEAAKLFIERKSHRCPVVTKEGKLISILTQSAVLNLIASNVSSLGKLAQKTVHDLKLGTSPVITIPKTHRTIEAFQTMFERGISGIGVVDDQGTLIGNISARDLRYLDPSNIYHSMVIPCSSFVQQIINSYTEVQERSPVIACRPETNFEYVIGRLTANHIHRLYVTDKDHKPISVISLRDCIRAVFTHYNV